MNNTQNDDWRSTNLPVGKPGDRIETEEDWQSDSPECDTGGVFAWEWDKWVPVYDSVGCWYAGQTCGYPLVRWRPLPSVQEE